MAGGATWQTLIDSDFTDNASAGWPTGNAGSYDEYVGGGRYTLRVADGHDHSESPIGLPAVSDGSITAIVRLGGRGQVGLSARMNQTADTGYAFWIDRQGRCGGLRFANGTATVLFSVYANVINPAGDNTLEAQVVGGMLTFVVNGRPVYSRTDQRPLPAGTWGIYVSSALGEGSTQGHYARIAIYGRPTAVSPATLPTGPFHAMIDYDFSFGDNLSWGTGQSPHTHASIAHGRLTIGAIDEYTRVTTPLEFPDVADGQIDAVVRMEGAGRVGVSGRWVDNPDHYYTEYACWIDNKGDVGLTREIDGDRITPIELHSSVVHPYQDNTLVMRVQGNRVSFYVNDQRMFVYTDAHPLPAGAFGAYVSDYPGGPYVQGQYAHILIAY